MATIKKELSIEEKARKYDEAVEKARQLCAYPTTKPFISDLQDLFPELAESEDERIRKELIQFFSDKDEEDYEGMHPRAQIVAWLEKQGEHTDIPAEWSEEDERDFDVIRGIIYNSCNAEDASRLIEWLKSLRPQSTWKPSEEQIMALRWVLNNVPYNNHKEEISGLLEQIKDFV